MTDSSGLQPTSTPDEGLTIGSGVVVTATATDTSTGDTSEFSAGPPVQLLVTGGNNQSTGIGAAFAAPLQVTAEDAYGNLLVSVPITFARSRHRGERDVQPHNAADE